MFTFEYANMASRELVWAGMALIAFVVTILLIARILRSLQALNARIKAEPKKYRAWGPRWNFLFFLLLAMIFFGIGWLGYLGIGFLALMTPPPLREINQDASDWFAWFLIGMEMSHAVAQGLLWVTLWSLSNEQVRFWRRERWNPTTGIHSSSGQAT
jgi:cytochrome b561